MKAAILPLHPAPVGESLGEMARWGDMPGRKRLWCAAAATILALHCGAALALIWRADQETPPPSVPAAAMMIDLEPLPPAPPPQSRPQAEPPRVEPEKLDLKPVEKAEAVLPKPQPKPKPRPQPKVEIPPEPKPQPTAKPEENTQPQVTPAAAQKADAPTPAAPPAPPSNAVPTWQGALRAHLEKHKRYPSSAQARRQEGVVYVRFAMNREGMVLWSKLERGSGTARLDDEAVELVSRAQPLPPPPADVPGDAVEIVAPVQFFLRNGG